MKITNVELGMLSVPLRVPFKIARRRVDSVEDVIVLIRTDTGATGYGEAPLTASTGDTTGGIIDSDPHAPCPDADRTGRERVRGSHPQCADRAHPQYLSKGRCRYGALRSLRAALEHPRTQTARRSKDGIVTDITISVNAPEEIARRTRCHPPRLRHALKDQGVELIPRSMLPVLSPVRDAVGKDVRIRIDANQAWRPR